MVLGEFDITIDEVSGAVMTVDRTYERVKVQKPKDSKAILYPKIHDSSIPTTLFYVEHSIIVLGGISAG